MFTGLIEDVGEWIGLEQHGKAAKLSVKTALPVTEISFGDSIAVNGVCLTVEGISGQVVHFHCLAETLSRTNLGSVRKGGHLNLERALRLGDRLGGHLVSGHVDFCSRVLSARQMADDFELDVALPPEERCRVVQKGSIAINGVSLTVAALEANSIKVCLIPVTKAKTNLEALRPGELVNVETDMLGKYVVGYMERTRQEPSMESLRSAGFFE